MILEASQKLSGRPSRTPCNTVTSTTTPGRNHLRAHHGVWRSSRVRFFGLVRTVLDVFSVRSVRFGCCFLVLAVPVRAVPVHSVPVRFAAFMQAVLTSLPGVVHA